MSFADVLAAAPADQVVVFADELLTRASAGAHVYAAVVCAAESAGLDSGEAFRSMSLAFSARQPLSTALGWDWLREFELRGEPLVGLRAFVDR